MSQNNDQPKEKKGLIDLKTLRKKAAALFQAFQTSLVELALFIISSWTRLLIAVGILILGSMGLFGIFLLLVRGLRYLRFLLLCRRAGVFTSPRRAIRCSCSAALTILSLKKMPRRNNQELLNYAASLKPELSDEAAALFKIFYRSEYRSVPPEAADAEKAAFHLKKLRQCLKNN